jgi:DNA-binding MarR family transcriptional regulator
MNPSTQFDQLQVNLERLRGRMPDLPVSGVLLSRLLLHLGRGMASLFELEIRPFGLAEAEFRVLTTLFSQPEGVAHPSELGARTSQSPANMSRISDVLVERALITRVSSVYDRRKMVLRITEQGAQLVGRLLPMLYAPLQEIFKDFSGDDELHLVAQLKLVSMKLDEVLARRISDRPA